MRGTPSSSPEKPPRREKRPAPVDQADLRREQPSKGRSRPVESSDLTPVMAPDASGLPLGLWGGLDMGELERLLAALDLPPRSPALHAAVAAHDAGTAGGQSGAQLGSLPGRCGSRPSIALGLLSDMAEARKAAAPPALAEIFLVASSIGLGDR